jgi:hypothetical protein
MNENTITINIDEYKELQYDSQKLQALEAYGVSNWHCYEDALELLQEWLDDEL